jgi:hypothetical protein
MLDLSELFYGINGLFDGVGSLLWQVGCWIGGGVCCDLGALGSVGAAC